MSALTKIFVILHVIVSLMLAAGLIVFVNRVENFRKIATDAKDELRVAKNSNSLLTQDIVKVTAEKLVAEDQLHAQIDVVKAQLATEQTTVSSNAAIVAAKDADIAQVHAQNVTLAAQLAAKDKDLQQVRANDDALKADRDKVFATRDANERRITALTFERDVYRKNLDTTTEVKVDVESQLEKANEILRKYNLLPGSTAMSEKPVLNVIPSVNINGIVRDKRTIDGVPVATISLGSADAVVPGMQFSVVDGGNFLGYFIVDTVNLHDATGFLKGDKVGQVRPNITVVQTQNK